jgi:hypothetical protein
MYVPANAADHVGVTELPGVDGWYSTLPGLARLMHCIYDIREIREDSILT